MDLSEISSVNFCGLSLLDRRSHKMLDVRVIPVANAHCKPVACRNIFTGTGTPSLFVLIEEEQQELKMGLPRFVAMGVQVLGLLCPLET